MSLRSTSHSADGEGSTRSRKTPPRVMNTERDQALRVKKVTSADSGEADAPHYVMTSGRDPQWLID